LKPLDTQLQKNIFDLELNEPQIDAQYKHQEVTTVNGILDRLFKDKYKNLDGQSLK
jgi:hypothetical protein